MPLDAYGRLFDEIRRGTYRAQLEALRDRLALEIDKASESRELPALVKEMREVIKALDALPVPNSNTRLDELQARRKNRQAEKNDGVPAADA